MEFQEILQRRTIRRFQQKPLSEEDFRAILNAARLASCASNRQRLRYIAARESGLVAAILPLTAYAALVKPHRDPVPGVNSPAAFLAVTATEAPSPHLYADAGAAIQSLEFAAWERSIGCCWLGSFQQKQVAALLGVEDPERLLYLVALGYPAESPVAEDIQGDGNPRYYLDSNDVLHIPKWTVNSITEWK